MASKARKPSAAKTKVKAGAADKAPKPASEAAPSSQGSVSVEAGLLTPYLSSNGDWSVVHPEIKQKIQHGDFSNMEALFGSGPGVGQLIEHSLQWFHEDGGAGIDVDWYVDADPQTKKGSQRSIQPSRFNRALQETTCEEYKHRLLLEGQPQSVAGYLSGMKT